MYIFFICTVELLKYSKVFIYISRYLEQKIYNILIKFLEIKHFTTKKLQYVRLYISHQMKCTVILLSSETGSKIF